MTNYVALANYIVIACFIILFVWEFARPWMKSRYSIPLRWWNTIALYVTNRFLLVWLVPISTITAALYAQRGSIGLLNMLEWGLAIDLAIGVLLYDMCHYWIHRLYHTVPILWRLHRLHHSDPDVDIITELKHHPLEAIFSTFLGVGVIFALGINPFAVIARTLLVKAVSLASHANIRLNERLDYSLRLVIITPAMHRIHHSSWRPETDSNYGTLFSCWDRLFGSYVAKPRDGYENMELGLKEFRSERDVWLDRMLLQPFTKNSARADGISNTNTDNN